MEKLIIFAALGYPGSANPGLPAIPKSWEELVESALAARQAGASIVHFHGPHDQDGKIIPDAWGRVTEDIRKRCDVLIDFGQAGALGSSVSLCSNWGPDGRISLPSPSPIMTTGATILIAAISMSTIPTRVRNWKSTRAAAQSTA